MKTLYLLALSLALSSQLPAENPAPRPLPIDVVLATIDDDFFTGPNPSPDGRRIAFDVSDGREALAFDYDRQMYTLDGYPMWSSLALYRTHVTDVASGQTTALASPKGTSWSGSWSPDGRFFAFYSNRSGMSAVWIHDTTDGSVRRLSPLVSRMFRGTERPLWTPDGREIIFKAVPTGMTLLDLHRLNPAFVAKEEAGKATAENRQLSSGPRVYNSLEKPTAASLSLQWMDYRYLTDLVAVNVATGASRVIASRIRPLRYEISPDGKWVFAAEATGRNPRAQGLAFSLSVYPLAGGPGKLFAENVPLTDPVGCSWSPDSTRLAFVGRDPESKTTSPGWRCVVVNVNTGERTVDSPDFGESRMDRIPPLWTPDGKRVLLVVQPARDKAGLPGQRSRLVSLSADGSGHQFLGDFGNRGVKFVVQEPNIRCYWSPDHGRSLVVATHDDRTKQEAFFLLDTATGQSELLGEYPASIHYQAKGSPADRQHIWFFQEDAARPSELFQLNIESKEVRRLTNFSAPYAQADLGRSQLVEWISLTGEKLQGALLLPAGYQSARRYPLVTWIYGGRLGSDLVYNFSLGEGGLFNFQVLASRGYAVFFPDIPIRGTAPMKELESAVLTGINRVIELGIADPDRLAIMGQSFGGYNTIGLITQTNRFKAAIATSSGAADLFEGYSRWAPGAVDSFSYYETGQGAMKGTPWEFPQRYWENSPFFALDRVTTPLLLQRGMEDHISAGNGSVYLGLKRLGKEAEFLEYDHEGHVLQIPSNVIDFWERRLVWLDRHLGMQKPETGILRPE